VLVRRTGEPDVSGIKQQQRPMWLKASGMARLKLLLPTDNSNAVVAAAAAGGHDARSTHPPMLELWLQQQMLHRADLSCPQQCHGGLVLCSTPGTAGAANSTATSSSIVGITRPDNQVGQTVAACITGTYRSVCASSCAMPPGSHPSLTPPPPPAALAAKAE
jgi:hypothetical protein